MALQELKTIDKAALKKDADASKDKMNKAVGALDSNVKYADKTQHTVVRPDLLAKNFADAA